MEKVDNKDPQNSLVLPCIICGRELEQAGPETSHYPYAGTSFTSRGHYGSTVYDPMSNEYLMLNICDPCLIERRENIQRVIVSSPEYKLKYLAWTDEDE